MSILGDGDHVGVEIVRKVLIVMLDNARRDIWNVLVGSVLKAVPIWSR